MSFITKRERVFNEYVDPFDLPPRNEGKLKAYSSCTDARAWSHFLSDKTEHLVEIIKRNNEVCRGKYVPINVIVDMLMSAKNAEIARLKRKIGELEQMIKVFEQLELSCEQKCEIATAHAMIKAANKSLDELALDLDTSNFTEGIDSEGFMTGKSGGDEPSGKFKGDDWSEGVRGKASKVNQVDIACSCDASTSAYDVRIDDLEAALISKDAKLNAMQNTIAVMENDICEPYCIYAHIYTALEKIFATLRQNDKYRLFLDLMSSGKDTRCIDIKGKILFKLKVLEKFSTALLAPCSERFNYDETCECYTVQVEQLETTFALTSTEAKNRVTDDSKRAHLVADIMENEEMKDMLRKDDISGKHKQESTNEFYSIDDYSIDTENLNRLKNLQLNYDDLMTCYENLKHERDNLKMRCQKYQDMEEELESLKTQLREYNLLYSEREYYRKRSESLDTLKEQYLVLADESSNLETQLKAEAEINSIKSNTIEELRAGNIELEKKLNDSIISFEKEKNVLQCKLKESECKVMCQDQQIRSLSLQIDRILEQDHDRSQEDVPNAAIILDEIEELKEQIKNLKDALFCSEDEKQILQAQFEDNIKLINALKMEIEDWKGSYEKSVQRNEYLEKYTEDIRDEIHRLVDENRNLSLEVKEKTTAVDNLLNVIHNKSQEVNKLMDDIDSKRTENKELRKQLQEAVESYGSSVTDLEKEKRMVMESLQLARQESQELLEKVKDYDELVYRKENLSKTLDLQTDNCNELRNHLQNAIEDNKRLHLNLESQENNNSLLLQELQRLRDVNNYAVDNINSLQNERHHFELSLELTRKESEILEDKLKEFEGLREQMYNLRLSHEKLIKEKDKLEAQLHDKAKDLDDAICSVQLSKKESEHLLEKIQQSENLKEDMIKLSKNYQKLVNEKQVLQKDLLDKNKDLDNLLQTLNQLKNENADLLQKSKKVDQLDEDLLALKRAYDELSNEKLMLKADFDNKTEEINNLYNTLESKIEENRDLSTQIRTLTDQKQETDKNIAVLQDVNMNTQSTLNAVQRESEILINKLKNYETVLQDLNTLKETNQHILSAKERLEMELEKQGQALKKLEKDNYDLHQQAENILAQNEDLENALISARNEIITSASEGPIADIQKEIENMKLEKVANQKKIRDLLDKLDESENAISDLSEDVLARDDKIAILENHINSLEDEVRRLHANLAEVVTTGEQIKDHSYQKIDQTLNKMEAHHSKATHNMKMELARLKNENYKLEEQLSVTKIKSEESFRDRHKYVSQIIHLQNEREIIVTDIKQLELNSVGDSNLAPEQCCVEDVLKSLDRIRKCLDAKHSKGATLEQTLLKVQTSSQLLLSKADEAKRLVEKEKQKIINEKEQAIADRLNMEKQLLDLKLQLEHQSQTDKAIIKELESEILNQELIIGKFKESTESYVSKLKDEMQSLQNLYQNSLETISELKKQIQDLSEENERKINVIDKINLDFRVKSREVSSLQKKLDLLDNKPTNNVGIQIRESGSKNSVEVQVEKSDFKKNVKTQTDKSVDKIVIDETKDDSYDIQDIAMLKVNKPTQNKTVTDYMPNMSQPINEVQILTANLDPMIDFVKSSYIDYKIKRLSPGKLEQYSISCLDVDLNSNIDESLLTDGTLSIENNSLTTPSGKLSHNPNLVDIYNRDSMQTTSSKALENIDENGTNTVENNSDQRAVTSFGVNLPNKIFSSAKLNRNIDMNSGIFSSPSPNKYDDKDLFLIYQDSESDHADKVSKDNWVKHRPPKLLAEAMTEDSESNQANKVLEDKDRAKLRPSKILAEVMTVKPNKDSIYTSKQQPKVLQHKTHNEFIKKEPNNTSLPYQIQIDLPRVDHDESSSDTEKINYDTADISPDETRLQSSTYQNISQSKIHKVPVNQESGFLGNESHHKLSRVDAEFLLFKENNVNMQKKQQIPELHKVENFGLEYIMNTMQHELNPGVINDDKKLRKTRSDDLFTQIKDAYSSDPSSLKLSLTNAASSNYKTMTNSYPSPTKMSDHSQAKSMTEQSVSVDIGAPDFYEYRIRRLTETLENTEKDYKKKLDAIKIQYDTNIKNIINEHNQGVKSIQSLHEETLQDIIKIHENEVENLRSMSIEAMRKADKLEKENRLLKTKVQSCSCGCNSLDNEPIKISAMELKKRKSRCRGDTRMLTKTNVEAFNVKPKQRFHGPCTCSLDVNVSDTIRNIFEQVDVEQRKMAEHTYLKYIANKILNNSVESLDAQELSFLHLKVCRTWKSKMSKEEALQKRIDTLESELVNKQRHAQQHIAELDRKVAEERRRLQEVREAVCRSTPDWRPSTEESRTSTAVHISDSGLPPPAPPPTAANVRPCSCNSTSCFEVNERRSAGDLLPGASGVEPKLRRTKKPESRATLAKLDVEERREKKLYDEHPTRLRRTQERAGVARSNRK